MKRIEAYTWNEVIRTDYRWLLSRGAAALLVAHCGLDRPEPVPGLVISETSVLSALDPVLLGRV